VGVGGSPAPNNKIVRHRIRKDCKDV